MRPCFRFSVKCGEQSQCSFKLPLSDSFQVFQEKQRGKKGRSIRNVWPQSFLKTSPVTWERFTIQSYQTGRHCRALPLAFSLFVFLNFISVPVLFFFLLGSEYNANNMIRQDLKKTKKPLISCWITCLATVCHTDISFILSGKLTNE